jgi:dTDP-4-amino-4,6-dideoxygalactose transaminase
MNLPVTEDIADRIVRLPIYYSLTEEQQDYIIAKIYGFFGE